MACSRWFAEYMRPVYLTPEDPREVWQETLKRQSEAYSALVRVCISYLQKRDKDYADIICRNYSIYELLNICREALGER
jgi:hypothetical protein